PPRQPLPREGLPRGTVPRVRAHRPRNRHLAALSRSRRHGRGARVRRDAAGAAPPGRVMAPPQVSVVVPVFNEEAVLPALFARLYPALDALGTSYEILFVNDGSRDRSAALLREQFQARPDVTRVILFNGNFGQHMAIMA